MPKVIRTDEMNKCIGCFTCMQVCAGINRSDHSIRKSCIHIRTTGGLASQFVASVCRACLDPHCAEVCPSGALTPRKGGGVLLDPHRCIGCRRCRKACMAHAIGFDNEKQKPIICHHCGSCAKYCPHGCLTMLTVSD